MCLNRPKQKAWSEEQEAELQRLFMENQESPQTDQDVIDWLLDNLIEKSRTRRSVIKKLKELGLIFKAPTKRSNAAAVNKNIFIKDEDDKLRELYDEHRSELDCLKRIMEVFDKKRSKKAVVKRMVQLGLIADESEIMPAKKQRKRKEHEREENSSDSESSDDDQGPSRARVVVKKHQMNQREALGLRTELEESLKDALEWIIEALNEAADDFEEPSDDPDDAIPIVAFTESQKLAMENTQFTKLLTSINLQHPHDSEAYWKIPANMIPDELRQRAKLLAGEEVLEDEEIVVNNVSEDDNDSGDDLFTRLRAQRDALIYNRSDHEEERVAPLKQVKKLEVKVGKPNTKVVKKLLPEIVVDYSEALKWVVSTLKDKAENKTSDAIDEMLLMPSNQSHRAALDDENFCKLLVAVNMIEPDGVESFWRIPEALNAKELLNRAELLEMSEDSSDDEAQKNVIKRKKKAQPVPQESEDFGINTQELKQRLAELDSSDDEVDSEMSLQKSKRNVLESSDEEEMNGVETSLPTKQKGKRDRSEIADDTPDENEMNATNNQLKRIRRIADSSDDE